MSTLPPPAIQTAYLQAVKNITRRVEIYESDGITPWRPALKVYPFVTVDGDSVPGDSDLVSGSVGISYDRDERRSLEVVLDNRDGSYSPDPAGFWYDKIIKVFRGIDIPTIVQPPSIMVIEDAAGTNFNTLLTVLQAAGFYNVRYKTTNVTQADVVGVDIIIALSNINTPTTFAIINEAWRLGKVSVFTIGTAVTQAHYPTIISTTTAVTIGSAALKMNKAPTTIQPELNSPLFSTVSPTASSAAGFVPATVPAGVKIAAIDTSTARITALSNWYNGRKWIHIQEWDLATIANDPGGLDFLTRGFNWLNPQSAVTSWETQIGEFMIDTITEPRFPRQISLTCRDYTKKLINAMFGATTSFPKTAFAEDTIKTIAINGGINPNKIVMPGTHQALGTIQTLERGTTRWAAIKQIANAFNLEVYFDHVGNFIIRAFVDPTTAHPSYFFTSGPTASASLVNFTHTSADASMVNQVIVCGESSDSTVVPVSYIANNTNPSSPSNQQSLGIRSYYYTSPVITTVAQAKNLANKFLAIYALEEFVMTWDSFCFDWFEAGDVVDVNPAASDYRNPNESTPTRYLLTDITIPLGLGPMSSTGKRVLVVP